MEMHDHIAIPPLLCCHCKSNLIQREVNPSYVCYSLVMLAIAKWFAWPSL